MVLIKAILAGLAGVSLCMANISGIVTDTGGITPISGAVVSLEKGGQSATTGADGSFTINVGSGIIPGQLNQLLLHNPSATIRNGLLFVNVAEKCAVEVTTFDLTGKVLTKIQQTMESGTNTIALQNRAAGVYIYKIKTGKNEFVLKSLSIEGVTQRTGTSVQRTNNTLAKQAKVSAAINDVIAVTKTGYLNYRVIAKNSDTTGIQIKMIACEGTISDTDGNIYQTVKIGNQVWTVENLRVTKYNDGSAIPLDTSTATWNMATTPKYCYYNNTTNADSIKKYGALYNWYVVNPANPKKIAPTGWHVPTDAEWTILENYLIANGYNWDGTTTVNKIAKSLAAKTDWHTYSTTGTIGSDLTKNNSSGFSALPGGYRFNNGHFYSQSYSGYWWSASEYDASVAWSRYLYYVSDYLYRYSNYKSCGFSVRLLRD